MSREVRMVPENWKHPKLSGSNTFIPLRDNFREAVVNYEQAERDHGIKYVMECLGKLNVEDFMLPYCDDSERTQYMMYESASEGTPISPAFNTPEELARWLVDNNASSFGGRTASYDQWLIISRGEYVPSAMYTRENGLISGVESFYIDIDKFKQV